MHDELGDHGALRLDGSRNVAHWLFPALNNREPRRATLAVAVRASIHRVRGIVSLAAALAIPLQP